MGIDFGVKRTGIAITDPLKIIANSLPTIKTQNLFDFLKDYIGKEVIEKLVVGYPKQMNNKPSESMVHIEAFSEKFRSLFPEIPIEFIDERFTSKMAIQAMVQGGVKKKDRQNKALIDSVSATIILQSYLDSKKFKDQ